MPVLLGHFVPFAARITAVVLWFATDWFRALFDTLLWPILGFIFLPTTLVWYAVVQHRFDGQWTLWPIVGLVIALLIDVGQGRRRTSTPSRPPRPRKHAHA